MRGKACVVETSSHFYLFLFLILFSPWILFIFLFLDFSFEKLYIIYDSADRRSRPGCVTMAWRSTDDNAAAVVTVYNVDTYIYMCTRVWVWILYYSSKYSVYIVYLLPAPKAWEASRIIFFDFANSFFRHWFRYHADVYRRTT